MTIASSRAHKWNCHHRAVTVATLFMIVGCNSASAQSKTVCDEKTACSDGNQSDRKLERISNRHRLAARSRSAFAGVQLDANGNNIAIIGSRPAGCPHEYCGCGLRIYLGLSDKRLNLAWNWARFFPRTSAHAGAAAVRRGHVMLLESQVSGSVWIVRDYNSGSGLSRIHERDVRGYIFVEPRAGQQLTSRS
jgi:hypothetical protein